MWLDAPRRFFVFNVARRPERRATLARRIETDAGRRATLTDTGRRATLASWMLTPVSGT